MNKGHDLDTIRSDQPVARIEIVLYGSGMTRVEGQITDEKFALSMLETAKDVVRNYHQRQRMGKGESVLVPGKDTPLAGTPDAERLRMV